MIHPKTYLIMGLSAIILFLIVGLIYFFYPFLVTFSDDKKLTSNKSILLAILLIHFVILFTIFLGTSIFKKNLGNNILFIPLIITTLVIFQIVNFTGGLRNTPFIGLYPALLTIALIIYDRFQVVIVTFALIVLSLIGNLLIEHFKLNCEPKNYPDYYNWLYLVINCLIMFLLATVDYISKYSDRIPFITKLFPDKED